MALQAVDIQDAVNATLNKYGKMKYTDLMSSYNNTIAVKRVMRKNKMTFDGGPEAVWTIIHSTNGSARFVGIGAPDVSDMPNVTTQGKIGWKRLTWNWMMDGVLAAMNSGSAEKIFDMIQSQRIAAAGAMIELAEQRWWRTPSSTDTVNPNGLEYWIVKNATEGFNGSVPSGFSVVGNVSPTTYTRWKNYTIPYSAVSKTDLIRKMRKGMWETEFELLVDETPTYNTGDDYVLYSPYSVLGTVEELLEAQNDNLGTDIASQDGRVMFRKRPWHAVKELENDSTNPVYGINWGEMKTMALSGWWMKETHIPIKTDQHTVSVNHTDSVFNFMTRNRRRHFVASNGTTAMA